MYPPDKKDKRPSSAGPFQTIPLVNPEEIPPGEPKFFFGVDTGTGKSVAVRYKTDGDKIFILGID